MISDAERKRLISMVRRGILVQVLKRGLQFPRYNIYIYIYIFFFCQTLGTIYIISGF